MPVRDCDVLPYLRLKTHMRPSDCLAVFADGSKRPVFIYNNKFVIDTGTEFYEAEKFTGFQRFERKPPTFATELPAQKVVEPEPVEDEPANNYAGRAQLQARWNPNRLFKSNLTRETFGNLVVSEYLGVGANDSGTRYWRCECKHPHKKSIVATQADLITGVVDNCTNAQPVTDTIVNRGGRSAQSFNTNAKI